MSTEARNLVCLQYTSDKSSIFVSAQMPKEVKINIVSGYWSYDHDRFGTHFNGNSHFEIGKPDPQASLGDSTIIGVFDRTNDEHLQRMVLCWAEIHATQVMATSHP